MEKPLLSISSAESQLRCSRDKTLARKTGTKLLMRWFRSSHGRQRKKRPELCLCVRIFVCVCTPLPCLPPCIPTLKPTANFSFEVRSDPYLHGKEIVQIKPWHIRREGLAIFTSPEDRGHIPRPKPNRRARQTETR
ncbi:hypothetical protein VTJ04DRAFT_8155 [Mycothermus thermophilus]|uniref:uncharacterized protein n=1 Tax=Humicola insolens TaxID=85995 RepID=UPI003742F22A